MSNGISGDELHDLWLNQDREIEVGEDGDWKLTSGIETVKQSVAINAGGALRPLIGEPLTGSTYEDVQEEIFQAIDGDPQIESVDRVEVSQVNRSSGTVTIDVFTQYNNSFELEVTI